jgi:orotate phosphoribosyltransferase
MLSAPPARSGPFTQRSPPSAVRPSPLKDELREILQRRSVCRGQFTLASGAQSDFYVDAKLTTSDPKAAMLVGKVGWHLIQQTAAAQKITVNGIGGLTMGADWMALSIGIAAHLSDPSTAVRIFSVRKSAKEHGRLKRIEGNFSPGDSVVVVDDVVTTGGSTLQAIEAIEAAKGHVAFVVVLVDREEGGREAIERGGHIVVPIFTRSDLVDADAGRRSNIGPA